MGKRVLSRHQAREIIISLLYDYSYNTERDANITYEFFLRSLTDLETGYNALDIVADTYISKAYEDIISKLDIIDPIIKKASEKWSFDRITKVTISILRLAIYEILYREDIPPKVSVNEAVELAKTFCEDDAHLFVNGILGNVLRNNIQKPE